jgi:hypothetical protein
MKEKSTPNQMRILLKRMRGESYNSEPKSGTNTHSKEMSMRDMLGKTRRLNEEEVKQSNKKTIYDQAREEERFLKNFQDMPVSVKFRDLELFDNLVFWGATVDGVIQFIYKVTPDESTTGVEFNYLDDFSPDNPDNEIIIDRIEKYYESFAKYWRNNLLQ